MIKTLTINLNDLENGIKITSTDSGGSSTIRNVIWHLIKHVGTVRAYYDLWDEHVNKKDVHNLRGEDFDDQSEYLFVPYKSLLYRALKLYKPNFAKHVDSYYPTKTGFYYIHFLSHDDPNSKTTFKFDCLHDLIKSPKGLLKFINQNIGVK